MNIQERYDVNEGKNKYRRIDPSYKVDIYLGYNNDGKMSMVITEKGRIVKTNSSKLIEVALLKKEDERLSLVFNLLDNACKTMFLAFSKDIITACEAAGPEKAIATALKQWKYWKKMFETKPGELLDKNKIKGLVGELIQMRDYFIPNYGEENAVEAWMGPESGHKDFEINDTWYEIKSVNENAVQIRISSLEQLDSETDGHLLVCRLEETSSVNKRAVSLNSVVMNVMDMIDDPDVLDKLRTKLKNVGYCFNEDYNNVKFMYGGTTKFAVTKQFPCLRRSEVLPVIGEAEYTLTLSGISEYQEND